MIDLKCSRALLRAIALLVVLCSAEICNAQEGPRPAVLDQPAMLNQHATKSVLLGVTRAGARLVVVGERGLVLLSDDDGNHWQQAKVPVGVALTAVQFVDDQQGWAVGHQGVVLHTVDGGQTWEKQLDGVQVAELYRAAAEQGSGPQNGQRVKEAEQLVADGPDKPFLDVLFSDSRNGFVAGAYNLLLRTSDGGKTWQPWSWHVDNPQSYHFNSLLSADGALYIAGERGLLLRSRDGAQSFQKLSLPYEGSLFGIAASRHGELVAFGLRGAAFWSADRGDTWQRISTQVDSSFSAAVPLANGALLLATQAGELLVNAPGSEHFERVAGTCGAATAAVAISPSGSVVVAGPNGVFRECAGALSSAR
ncbi:WD40/YVTN/BNR-like repeat-containing protein [Pseudomonas sp. NPDC096950]|uniref:WD40/YVTN/BNR-like repeat-containing protein n=1 Tax=Pseudomonas sp. NPDC096950 TaxID=3364485 RepID=UPI00383ABC77